MTEQHTPLAISFFIAVYYKLGTQSQGILRILHTSSQHICVCVYSVSTFTLGPSKVPHAFLYASCFARCHYKSRPPVSSPFQLLHHTCVLARGHGFRTIMFLFYSLHTYLLLGSVKITAISAMHRISSMFLQTLSQFIIATADSTFRLRTHLQVTLVYIQLVIFPLMASLFIHLLYAPSYCCLPASPIAPHLTRECLIACLSSVCIGQVS